MKTITLEKLKKIFKNKGYVLNDNDDGSYSVQDINGIKIKNNLKVVDFQIFKMRQDGYTELDEDKFNNLIGIKK